MTRSRLMSHAEPQSVSGARTSEFIADTEVAATMAARALYNEETRAENLCAADKNQQTNQTNVGELKSLLFQNCQVP